MLYTNDAKKNFLQDYLGQFLNHKLISRPLKIQLYNVMFLGTIKNKFLLEKVASFGASLS